MKILKFIVNDVGDTVQLADDQDVGSYIGRLIAGQTELVKTLHYGVDSESIGDLQLQVTDFDNALTISINGSIIKKGEIVNVHKGVLTPGYKSEPIRLAIRADKSISVADGKQHRIGLKLNYLYPGR
jgi:hypothetical protein